MSGFYLGVGLCCILLAQPLLYMALGFSWLFTAFGRIVSMMSDRGNTLYNWVWLAIELVLAALAAGLRVRLRAVNQPPLARPAGQCDNSAGNACRPTCCGLQKPVLDGNRLSTGGCGARTLIVEKIQ